MNERKEYSKQYYQKNKVRISENQKKYTLKNRDKIIARMKIYSSENKDKIKLKNHLLYARDKVRKLKVTREWQKNNKEKIKIAYKKWREKNKEKVLIKARISSKKWAIDNPERIKENRHKTRDKLRTDVLSAYGDKCRCCGESTRQFLSIDHMNGGGSKHKRDLGLKSSQAFYTWLRKNNYPEGFQVLCHNCNMAKGFYGKCPHLQ